MLRAILVLLFVNIIACGSDGDTDNTSNGKQKIIPRNRTLIMDCPEANTCSGQIQDYNSFNPFIPGGISRIGYNFLFEPLFFLTPTETSQN